MKEIETIKINDVEYVRKALSLFGYKTTAPKSKNANGVDIFAVSEFTALSVEIKTAKNVSKNKSLFRIRSVEKGRINDDLIAIVFPNGYVLIEPMKHHLKNCNKTGDRFILI